MDYERPPQSRYENTPYELISKFVDVALRDKEGCCPVYAIANRVAHDFVQKPAHSGVAAKGLQ